MKLKSLYVLLPLLLLTAGYKADAKKITKIVVDAGHGGKDFGARGAFSNEKDITLATSLKLGKILTDSLKGVQVIYTRTTDVYPTLQERHQIANDASADMFLAIHVNSTPYTYSHTQVGTKTVTKHHKKVKVPIYKSVRHHTTTRTGVETYVLPLHRMRQLKGEVENEFAKDNSVDSNKDKLNLDDPETAIIVAQYAEAYFHRSISLGGKIQSAFAKQGRDDLGVKQLSLEVLAGSAMPSVLIEIGFITNTEEEEYLNSEKGQTEVAMAIYKGIVAYIAEVESDR